MKAFRGKIGKYRQLSQRGRSRAWIKRSTEQRKMDRAFIQSHLDEGFKVEWGLIEKLKLKKGGKFRDQVLIEESLRQEWMDICPGWA